MKDEKEQKFLDNLIYSRDQFRDQKKKDTPYTLSISSGCQIWAIGRNIIFEALIVRIMTICIRVLNALTSGS